MGELGCEFRGRFFLSPCPESVGGKAEKKLLRYLFDPKRPDAFNILERPTSDDNKPLAVSILIFLMQIIDVVRYGFLGD